MDGPWVTSFVGSSELTLVNPAAAVVGAAVETDAALRLRYFQVLAQAGAGTVQAILASVLALATVTQARVYENDSNVLGISTPESIPTLPAHSFLVVARGTYDPGTLPRRSSRPSRRASRPLARTRPR